MSQRTSPLLPATERRLRELGERLRLARLRRKLTAVQVAERAGMSPMTLRGIERGGPGATIGGYAAVLQVLGLDSDIDLVGAQDALGRDLQDSRLRRGPDAAAPSGSPARSRVPAKGGAGAASAPKVTGVPAQPAAGRRSASFGVDADELAKLVSPAAPGRRKR